MQLTHRLAHLAGAATLKALRVRVESTGTEQVPARGPVLLAATHVSYPDFVFVQHALAKRRPYVRFLTRYDVWDQPVLGALMDRMRHVPVDREAPAGALLRALRLLECGEAVAGFPEAGISYSFTVRPLMRGLVALARMTGAPLVPVGVWGTQRIFSVGDPEPAPDLLRGRRVDLAFGAPMRVMPGDDLTERTLELGHRLTGLLEPLQLMAHHRPRPGEVATWYPAHLGGHAPTRHRARELDEVPFSAVIPTWGPDLDAFDATTG